MHVLGFQWWKTAKKVLLLFPSNHANKQHVSCLFTLLNANQMGDSLGTEKMFWFLFSASSCFPKGHLLDLEALRINLKVCKLSFCCKKYVIWLRQTKNRKHLYWVVKMGNRETYMSVLYDRRNISCSFWNIWTPFIDTARKKKLFVDLILQLRIYCFGC